jgi:hypothetical protein
VAAMKGRDKIEPTPGIVINRGHILSSRTRDNSFRRGFPTCSQTLCRGSSKRNDPDKASDPFFQFDHANGSKLEPKIAREPSDVIPDGDGIFL